MAMGYMKGKSYIKINGSDLVALSNYVNVCQWSCDCSLVDVIDTTHDLTGHLLQLALGAVRT